MPGLLGVIGIDGNDIESVCSYIDEVENTKEYKQGKKFFIESSKNKKFIHDKLFYEDEEYFIATDGVLLNSSMLKQRYKEDELSKVVIKMYEMHGENFCNEFRGSYAGIIYDKLKKQWIVFTDQLGDKKIYYAEIDGKFIFSSRISYAIKFLKDNNISYSLNENAGYCLLTQGFMLDEYTICNEIKRLLPGHVIKLKDNKVSVHEYFKLDNTPDNSLKEDEVIDKLDHLFREAVKLQFNKDVEYGYKHIASLSGGLDSRMTTWVAHDLGFNNILNYTFSQSNYLDEKIAKDIATDLNHEFIFKSLDDGKFLYDIDNVISINGGTSVYYGMAHSKNSLDTINLDTYGLVHTGQLGDVVIGTFSSKIQHEPATLEAGAYSTKLAERLKNMDIEMYQNEEIFKFYQRGFNGALSGNLAFQEKTESFSPFYDLDFLTFCLKIPLEFRFKHKLYYKWILKKYPAAANYQYERIKGKIIWPTWYVKGKNLGMKILNKSLTTIGLNGIYGYNSKYGMNPFDYWYRTNKEMKKFIDTYFEENIENLSSTKGLQDDCIQLFKEGSTVEKIQVLTLLGATKLYFGEFK
ncbi:hypothetical protein [Bacillus paranthracis]|uniref:hypothetical protein n=1 Tax=Bacillus cereus group TaxID=86661 RepID=UPI000935BB09|nr:asparagine synthase [Bacillus cereus]